MASGVGQQESRLQLTVRSKDYVFGRVLIRRACAGRPLWRVVDPFL